MADDSALQLTVDGEVYALRFSDLSAIDAKDFRAAVGVPLAQVMANGSVDLDVAAGLVWLARRKRERGLAFATVAKALKYDTPLDVKAVGEDEVVDEPGEA